MKLPMDVFYGRPFAVAAVNGDKAHPEISGHVWFYRAPGGTVVEADVIGLPMNEGACTERVFGFHVHEGEFCSGNAQDPFADAGTHYNPQGCEHPQHAGDLPPLFGNNGVAWMMVYTNRFTPQEVVGKTVIIHDHPDDFHTQPAGNSGAKIACGRILRMT